ncbi:MAG: hypothetical protein ABGX16_04870 [Pirellulales bacterium]
MMSRQENKIVGHCPQQTLSKVMIVFAVVAFSWLSAFTEESQAQRSREYRAVVGPVAEKPLPPIRGTDRSLSPVAHETPSVVETDAS